MFKPLLFLYLIVIVNLPVLSQANCDKTVKGVVRDITTNEPLQFVAVRVEETSTGTVTDENGIFEINGLCENEVHLEFTLLGYKTVVHHHDTHHEMPTILMAEEEINLEGVVVEGEQIRAGTKTLKSELVDVKSLQKFGSVEFEDIAAQISGLSLIKTGQNVQKPVLHGLSGNRILLMQQGIRYEYQSWGDDHGPGIDPNSSESIEVIKGAGTVKYGPEAMGGVIIFNPQKLHLHDPFSFETQLAGHTNGRGLDGRILLKQGFDHWSFMANGSGSLSGDLQSPNFSLTNTGKRVWNSSAGIRYHHADYDIEGYYSHNDQELGILRGSVTGNLEDLTRAMNAEILIIQRNLGTS
ncbi:MAG: carboxypeptidase-like regulatory domain-containing protein [Bacteroidota bacterium]